MICEMEVHVNICSPIIDYRERNGDVVEQYFYKAKSLSLRLSPVGVILLHVEVVTTC